MLHGLSCIQCLKGPPVYNAQRGDAITIAKGIQFSVPEDKSLHLSLDCKQEDLPPNNIITLCMPFSIDSAVVLYICT